MEPPKTLSTPPERATWIHDALAASPVRYEFSLGQSEITRQQMIASLPAEAMRAVFLILTRYVCNEYCENVHAEGEDGEGLAYLMRTQPADMEDNEDIHSDDWRLRVFHTEAGTLYDFNGWPGDNECGAARFYPAAGEPFDVFTNSDESLTATEGTFIKVVEEYAQRREDENRGTTSANWAEFKATLETEASAESD